MFVQLNFGEVQQLGRPRRFVSRIHRLSTTTLLPCAGADKVGRMKNGKSRPTERTELGRYIVADPDICHGKPTFKGTRIMVWQVLDDVADGRSWDFICNTRWGGRIPLAAVAEAVKLAEEAWLGERARPFRRSARKSSTLAAA
jgi:hypothetical protein